MLSVPLKRIDGIALSLRLVEVQDAKYIHRLRLNPRYNSYLSKVTGTVSDQEDWIRSYKSREAAGHELYYVVERITDSVRCGLVRLYDMTSNRFTWGSWILDENKPPKAALESAVLSFGVGFTQLELLTADIDVRNDNVKARRFYERLGMTFLSANGTDSFYEYSRSRFMSDLEGHMEIIRTAQNA
ncbi:GNAT family N-acetyltransferase [uncultured Roseobacter sp.]|uniref:GNAT family N-acetyltransferase n=1 Tax=uncultured Roseobacter sp. TaxID=114847 RepID=UPI0026184ACA|nr:GNAT family N-acetyltransferase [uncultured Roseobacter sp.]